MRANPLLAESALPFHTPPFDKIRNEDFAPAYEKGMAEELKQVQKIATTPDEPTFENTIVAMERAGVLLRGAAARRPRGFLFGLDAVPQRIDGLRRQWLRRSADRRVCERRIAGGRIATAGRKKAFAGAKTAYIDTHS